VKKIVFDEINAHDMGRIRQYLEENAFPSEITDLYWVDIQDDLLDETQCQHHACKPYRFAVELTKHSVNLELLIRSKNTLRCDCIQYATPIQRDFILRFGDLIMTECKVRT